MGTASKQEGHALESGAGDAFGPGGGGGLRRWQRRDASWGGVKIN